MSELTANDRQRKELLKHMILQLHKGVAPEAVRKQLAELMGQVPYEDVVAVEQELIAEGLPTEEVLKLCDVHGAVLKGQIDHSGARTAPAGHPVHTFIQENRALQLEVAALEGLFTRAGAEFSSDLVFEMIGHFNALAEVDKHYRRKEYLLFPILEKKGITGPPTVMWGKHDEARALLKAAREALQALTEADQEALAGTIDLLLRQAAEAVEEMIYKEEQILFPMCLDSLSEGEWARILAGTAEIGYCLFAPTAVWTPAPQALAAEGTEETAATAPGTPLAGRIQLPTGSFSLEELTAVMNALPFDVTFVDADDTVRFYSEGRERVFERNLAVIGRKVQLCHPPKSMYIVQQILDDFRSGRQSRAPFWITMGGKFIHIEYFALRTAAGDYLGTLEVTQDLTEKRQLTGDQRLLSNARE
ncbi:MAG TPA: DUF438 domain-containing protein [bacterium]|nr:DUF438 domain-containing protein [bacterium]HPR89622.1 DUF438 domain-containing protein [bacterium]